MRSSRAIHVVSCHAEGEVGDVIVGGVAPPPGDTLWAQRAWIAQDDRLRRFLLNEPRGGVFRHVNLLTPPKDPRANMGFIVMEPADTPPMSGSNAICVTTVLLETGVLPMSQPITEIVLEAPGGLVRARADCADGRVARVTIENLPSFAVALDQSVGSPGRPNLVVDIAYGGDSFVAVDLSREPNAMLGLELAPGRADDIAKAGAWITALADQSIGFSHPENPDWTHLSFCLFHKTIAPIDRTPTVATAVAIRPGKIDRSPCGTGLSALMALRHARDEMSVGDRLIGRSLIGGRFDGEILAETQVGGRDAIQPSISGRAWITGFHQHLLDPRDPWPEGYRLSDTWPNDL